MKKLALGLIFAVLMLLQVLPGFAAILDVSLIPQVQGNCSTTIRPLFNISGTGQNADTTSPNRDWFTAVLFDGSGAPVGYLANWISVGFTGGVNNWSFGNLTIVNQPLSRPFTIRIYDVSTNAINSLAAAMNGPELDSITFDPAAVNACQSLPVYTPPPSGIIQPINDGRINKWDHGAPVAVYPHVNGESTGLVAYSTTTGELLMLVTPDTLAAVESCPAENTLIASAGGLSLYRLTSCEYQLNAPTADGKTYTLIFSELNMNASYTSFEA